MNAVQKKQLFFALRVVIVVLVLVLGAVANPVSAAQVMMPDSITTHAVRGSANAAPAANASSSAGETEIFGLVESINGSVWVIGGQTITVTGMTEIKGAPGVGTLVKVHLTASADGTLTAREIEPAQGAGGADASGSGDLNDDNGGSGGDDIADDNSGSSGDDIADDSGDDLDDDHGGSGSGADDDSSNDDSSGSGSENNNGGDDHSGDHD